MGKAKHKIFIGMTDAGKTYEAKKQMLSASKGVLFVNYVEKEKSRGFEQVSKNTDIDLIKTLLRNGRKVQYNCSRKSFDREMLALYNVFENFNDFIFCIDEIHLLNKEVKSEISNLWKTGKHNGIEAWGITQRPTELDRAMITQSKELYIFKTVMEDGFFNLYKIDKSLLPNEIWKYYLIER
jgi:hypothetical protein